MNFPFDTLRSRCAAIGTLALLLGASLSAHATTFTVTSTADTAGTSCGATCTLRQAITAANSDSVASTIAFNIPGTGVKKIFLGSALPAIQHRMSINGYSQPGASENTLAVGDNRVIRIELTQTAATVVTGLQILADNCLVQGLAIVPFGNGIQLGSGESESANNSTIRGNFIGLRADGTTVVSTQQSGGAGVQIVKADNSLIGGTTPQARNVFARHFFGIRASGDGTDASTHVSILNNYFGTDSQGVAERPLVFGIVLEGDAADFTIGNDIAPNLIAFSGNKGIVILFTGAGHSLFANDFKENGSLAIDLSQTSSGGVTLNDINDIDDGPNHLQNFPVLANATQNYDRVIVNGSLDIQHSATNILTPFTIAVYASSACDSSLHGEGEIYLGSQISNVFDGTSVSESINTSLIARPPIGSVITETATDAAGNTSEFSLCAPLVQGDGIFKDDFEI